MSMTDPIADMLTRIRNALAAEQDVVEMPHSLLKTEIGRLLKKKGYVTDYVVEGGARKILRIYLKYDEEREPAIRGIKRESRPGLRRYVGADEVPNVLGGLGMTIMSTPSGVMTGREARANRVGGEVLCAVW